MIVTMTDIPRRCRVDLYSPGEAAIYEAIAAVEAMGADVALTDAVVLLSKAKDKVADFVDGADLPMVGSAAPEVNQWQGASMADNEALARGVELVPPEVVSELLNYDPETGYLFWKHRPLCYFKSQGSFLSWNTKYSGKRAFTFLGNRGYFQGAIFSKLYLAHRVVWVLVHKKWPDQEIDHINGIGTDNRIANLREVGRLENSQNMPRPKTNNSGMIGVFWSKTNKKWFARIGHNGKHVHLGSFLTKAEAVTARKAAESVYGFHPNHGRQL